MHRISLILVFLFCLSGSFAQNKIELLKSQIDTLSNDTTKAAMYRSLAGTFAKFNKDSAVFYFMESIDLSRQISNTRQEAKTLRAIGIFLKNQGKTDSALTCYNQSLAIHLADSNEKEAAYVYNNIGIVYKNLARYDKAIDFYIQSLKLFDKLENDAGKALVYNNIGVVHKNQKKYDLAIEYYYKALEINQKQDRIDPMASNYNNIGLLLVNLNQKDSALLCYEKALELRKQDKDEEGEANCYVLIGEVFADKAQWKKAIVNYYKALPILKKHKSTLSLIHLYDSFAKANYNQAVLKNNSKYLLNKAQDYAQQSLDLSLEVSYVRGAVNAYSRLSKIYEVQGKTKDALEAYKFYVSLNDSLFDIDRASQIAMSESKYNSEKKELEIEKLKKDQELKNERIARQELESRKQKILQYVYGLGIFFLLVFVLYVLRSLKNKKKANFILKEQKEEITAQNEELNQMIEEITAQKEEISSQRDLVSLQKQLLEDANRNVEKSIEYAKKIQRSILADTHVLKEDFADSFVFYKPRDIVSGDFYWWAKLEGQFVMTAADSTGHGVPGAFMSMLGVSFLREIVLKEYITHPGVILRKMRKEIINTLRQKQENKDDRWSLTVKDGMDMALVSINLKTKLMQYAGANNPIYILKKYPLKEVPEGVRLYEPSSSSYKLYEFKADKMPISIYDRMDRFQTHEIQLEEGDQVYLFSDGFADQFGGPKNKKFKYKPFKNLLLEHAHLSMEEQKEVLYQNFMSWKGEEEQIDDLLVLGVKI